MIRLAITGGTGFVGGHVLRKAVLDGHSVKALTRREQPPLDGINWVPGTLGDQECLNELVRDTDAVIHIAGAIRARDRAGFAEANIDGTRNLVEAVKGTSPARFVHISSLAAREPQLSDYGWSKAQSEKFVQQAETDWTIIRPPAVYGPGDGETLELFAMAARGLVILPPDGRASLINVEDLAQLILICTEADGTIGKIYEPDDGNADGISHSEFAKALGRAVGKTPRTVSMPAPLVRLGARFDELFRGDNAKLTRDRARYFCHDDWVANPALRPPKTIWSPAIPTKDGLAATAHWYREQGWLS